MWKTSQTSMENTNNSKSFSMEPRHGIMIGVAVVLMGLPLTITISVYHQQLQKTHELLEKFVQTNHTVSLLERKQLIRQLNVSEETIRQMRRELDELEIELSTAQNYIGELETLKELHEEEKAEFGEALDALQLKLNESQLTVKEHKDRVRHLEIELNVANNNIQWLQEEVRELSKGAAPQHHIHVVMVLLVFVVTSFLWNI